MVSIGSAVVVHERSLAAAVRDPVAESVFRDYRGWKRVNSPPVLSEPHNDTFVVTYLNPRAEGPALAGPFALVNGRPGPRGAVFVMEKRARGYDAPNADWRWAVIEPDGKIGMSGSGRRDQDTALCAECHVKARVNDFVFGRGTEMKVTPIK
jgi:hypothetical protein